MCFSAAASFAVGTTLLPAGLYCVRQAVVKRLSYLALAAMPLFFGIQQISEGFVWLSLARDDAAQARTASLVFLIFALAVWPFWLPFQAALMERQLGRRRFLIALTLLSTIWFWVLFYPLAMDAEGLLTTNIHHHSIQYDIAGLPIYRIASKDVLRVLYFANVALPLAICSDRWGIVPGIVLGVAALVAAFLFQYTFVSVWCFFAAVMAGYLCFVFHRLPHSPTPSKRDEFDQISCATLENQSPRL